MAFRLKKNESAAAGIRRVARGEIEDSLELIEKKDVDPEELVHELRKHFKKFRAVTRLVQDELGDEIYERDQGAVRDLGRRLSSARDASVRVTALDRLRKAHEKNFPTDGVEPIRRRLLALRRAATGRVRRGSAMSEIGRDLESLVKRVRAWPLQREGFSLVEVGLRRGYRQGRAAEAEAYGSRTDEAFHEWRKRAKDLRYHVDLLSPIWPETMADLEKTLHDLTDRLGGDHDFADLRGALTSSPRLVEGSDTVPTVIELIDKERSELQAAARPLGVRVYSEKPRAFTKRIGSYWDAWRFCPDDRSLREA
jgi:CHAD domain-containing protein